MEISFEDKRLMQCANDSKKARKHLGQSADKFRVRLDTLASAETLEDVRQAPGRFHELTGDRKGQWACSVSGNYRLIFRPTQIPIPEKEDGGYDWSAIRAVTVLEIEDYH